MINNHKQIAQTPAGFLKSIGIIHIALLTGQVLFGAVAFSITMNGPVARPADNDILTYLVPLMAVFSLITSNFLYKQKISSIAGLNSLREKLTAYQTIIIVRFALLEGASLFGIVSYMLTGNLLLLAVSGLIISYFLYLRPSRQKIEDDLNLSYEEKLEMDSTEIMK